MNRRQVIVLRVALAGTVLSLLLPPWGYGPWGALRFVGYSWIFAPPEGMSIALHHFVWQTGLLAVVTFLAYRLAGARPPGER